MRQVRYGVATSLDGFIAGPNGEADWIVIDPDMDFGEAMARFDTLLIGRKTWEAMQSMGGGGGGMGPDVRAVLASRTIDPAAHPDLTIVDDAVAYVAELKTRPGKDIWLFGGGELFRSLLGAGLVDGVDVAVIPVLLGGGVPLVPGLSDRATLRLLKSHVFEKTGTLSLEYDIVARD